MWGRWGRWSRGGLVAAVAVICGELRAAVFTVTTTADSGVGSLRKAILDANGAAGTDTIRFNIAGSGVKTISPGAALPTVSEPVLMDGTTQSGYFGSPMIELNGTGAGAATSGLSVTAPGCTFRGLAINRFGGNGILLGAGSSGATVHGCVIGASPDGGTARPNGVGIRMVSGGHVIGGTALFEGNVISGNSSRGIQIVSGSNGNTIRGNTIGLNRSQSSVLANAVGGISVAGAQNVVGGSASAEGNVIGGGQVGVELTGNGATANKVLGNRIGTNGSFVTGLGCGTGVGIRSGASGNEVGGLGAQEGNVIAYNGTGVLVAETGTGNYVLTNSFFGNHDSGIDLGGDGFTPNDYSDSDGGPNGLQNYPTLTGFMANTVFGTLKGAPTTLYRIQVYRDDAAQVGGPGQGRSFVTSTLVTTDGAGNANFALNTGGTSLPPFARLMATATTGGSTSEFSPVFAYSLGGQVKVTAPAGEVLMPGSCHPVTVPITNLSPTTFPASTGALVSETPGVTVVAGGPNVTYGAVASGATDPGSKPFWIGVGSSVPCGTRIRLRLDLSTAQGNSSIRYEVPVGLVSTGNHDSAGPVPIAASAVSDSPVQVSGNEAEVVVSAEVSLALTHPSPAGLALQLISPNGLAFALAGPQAGLGGSGIGGACSPVSERATFSDNAPFGSVLKSVPAPYVGVFRPSTPLRDFPVGKTPTVPGAWKLRVVNSTAAAGTIQCWSLKLTRAACTEGDGDCFGNIRVGEADVVGTNQSNRVNPGGCHELYIPLHNTGNGARTGISMKLVPLTPGVSVVQGQSVYPDLPGHSSAQNAVPFKIQLDAALACGAPVDLLATVTTANGTVTETIRLQSVAISQSNNLSGGDPMAIPLFGLADTPLTVSLSSSNSVASFIVYAHIQHPRIQDLTLQLIAPDNTMAVLAQNRGGAGRDFGTGQSYSQSTVFRDDAVHTLDEGVAPLLGEFRPEQSLRAAFAGKPASSMAGTWRLRVINGGFSPGSVVHWGMGVSFGTCDPGSPCPPPSSLTENFSSGPAGWTPFGPEMPGLTAMGYDGGSGALVALVAADQQSRTRVAGWRSNGESNLSMAVARGRVVRGKFYLYAAGQAGPDRKEIPNFRLRISNRFAVASVLDVYHHSSSDPESDKLGQDLRPSKDKAKPSLYRLDYLPPAIPYLAENAATESVSRAFEAVASEPQENGVLGLAESTIGVYDIGALQGEKTLKSYDASEGDFNGAYLQKKVLSYAGVQPGGQPVVVSAGPQPSAAVATTGVVTLDSTSIPADRIGLATADFLNGAAEDSDLTKRARVEPGKLYRASFLLSSTQKQANNAMIRMRMRTAKFAWNQRLEIGGAWAIGTDSKTGNAAIAQQSMPAAAGGDRPDRAPVPIGEHGSNGGTWYDLFMHTPLASDIRPEFAGGTPVTQRMPNLAAQDPPGVNTNPVPGSVSKSRRDILFGLDLLDTWSSGPNAHLEQGNVTLNAIVLESYDSFVD